MAHVLKRLSIENKDDKENLCIIPAPPIEKQILVKIRDKKTIIQSSTYFFLDKLNSVLGSIFVWNNYKHCSEKINVSLIDSENYLLELPENLIVDAAYY